MSFETLIWVRTQKTGNCASRSVLRVLADHAGQDHSCYLRTRLIASEADLSEAGVRKALARLIEAGLVRVYERYNDAGARRSNRYQLLPDGADTPPPDAEDWADVRERAPLADVDAPRNEREGEGVNEGEGLPPKEASREEATPVKGRATRSTATRVPEDFAPTDALRAWFAKEQLGSVINGITEHEKFMDYWRGCPGVKGRKHDWPATWRNWMRTAADRAGRRYAQTGNSLVPTSGAPAYRPSTGDQRMAQAQMLYDKYSKMEEEGSL